MQLQPPPTEPDLSGPGADLLFRPIMGIDPGITGGIAFLYPFSDRGCSNRIAAFDIPTVGGEVDVDTLAATIDLHNPRVAIIERANAMPKQGVSSSFKYGVAFGALRTICTLGRIPYHLVSASKWKNYYRLSPDKEKSRALAIQFWPGVGYFSLKKHHNRAEAALLARYGAEVILREVTANEAN